MSKFIVFIALLPNTLLACPLCHTTTAEQVRTNLVKTALDGVTVPALVLPFAILLMTIWLLHVDWSEMQKKLFTLLH